MGEFGGYLPQDRITIGDLLKRAGYRCGIVGPWHLGDDHRPQHGFSDFWRTYRYLGDYPDPLFDYFETEGVENLYRSGAPLNALEGTNTVVAFISDHGELLGDHGYTEKCLMYEASVRVPCLLSWQNHLPSGFRVTTPLAGVDLMPTLLSFAGQAPETQIDGRSVAEAILNGREPEPQPIFAEIASLDAIYHNANEPEKLAAHVMVADGDWKYIWNRFDIDELYNLKTDPGEMRNVANRPEHQNRIAQMRQQIAEMVCRTGPGPYAWCL